MREVEVEVEVEVARRKKKRSTNSHSLSWVMKHNKGEHKSIKRGGES